VRECPRTKPHWLELQHAVRAELAWVPRSHTTE
jgi:hypothetical protein